MGLMKAKCNEVNVLLNPLPDYWENFHTQLYPSRQQCNYHTHQQQREIAGYDALGAVTSLKSNSPLVAREITPRDAKILSLVRDSTEMDVTYLGTEHRRTRLFHIIISYHL